MNTYKAIRLSIQKYHNLIGNNIMRNNNSYIAINYNPPIKKTIKLVTHEYGYKCLAISYQHNRINGAFIYTDYYRISHILLVVINLIFIIMAIITFYMLITK